MAHDPGRPPYESYAAIAGAFGGLLAAAGALGRLLDRDPQCQTMLDFAVLAAASFKASRTLSHDASEKGGSQTGASPVDRGRRDSKHHLLVEAGGVPLAWTLTGGNRNDVTQLLALLDRVPPVRGRVGRPRRRPQCLLADRGYDHDK